MTVPTAGLTCGPVSQPRCANNALDTTAKPWPAFLRPSDGDSSVLGPESFKLDTKRTDLQTATQRPFHEPPQRSLNASAAVPPAGGVPPPSMEGSPQQHSGNTWQITAALESPSRCSKQNLLLYSFMTTSAYLPVVGCL